MIWYDSCLGQEETGPKWKAMHVIWPSNEDSIWSFTLVCIFFSLSCSRFLLVFLHTCFVLRYTRGAATAPSERGPGRHLPLQQEPASGPLVSFTILNISNTHNCYVGINSGKSKPVVSLQVLLEDPLWPWDWSWCRPCWVEQPPSAGAYRVQGTGYSRPAKSHSSDGIVI